MLYKGTPFEDSTKSVYQLAAGNLNLTMELQWPDSIQELYDSYKRLVDNLVKADSLVSADGSTILNDYDWLSYYFSLGVVDLDIWLEHATFLPASLVNMPKFRQFDVLRQRGMQAQQLTTVINQLKDCLVWNVVIQDGVGQTVTTIRTGGWVIGPEMAWKLRFTSPRENIGKNDLQYVTIELEV